MAIPYRMATDLEIERLWPLRFDPTNGGTSIQLAMLAGMGCHNVMNDKIRQDWLSTETEISDHQDFARFLIALAEDLRKNPAHWERTDLGRYLRTMAHWTMNSVEAVNRNRGRPGIPDPPSWRAFADILLAGKVVED